MTRFLFHQLFGINRIPEKVRQIVTFNPILGRGPLNNPLISMMKKMTAALANGDMLPIR
jgi:hypothetical protein